MLFRSPVDLSSGRRARAPSVGIFFGAMLNGSPMILYEASRLAEAEAYGLCKTHPQGHLEAWETSRATLSLQDDYDDYPRGRIVFDTRSGRFIVYLDRHLDAPVFRRAVIHYFALPEGFAVFRHDAHYSRARHRMNLERS